MLRGIIGGLGLLAALFPHRMIALFEDLAIESASESDRRRWVGTAIRSEGALVAITSLVGGRPYKWMLNTTGFFGGVVLVAPNLYRRFATWLLYERPDSVVWNERFTTFVRVIGVLYVLLAAVASRNRTADT
jgi:hypothetical protein